MALILSGLEDLIPTVWAPNMAEYPGGLIGVAHGKTKGVSISHYKENTQETGKPVAANYESFSRQVGNSSAEQYSTKNKQCNCYHAIGFLICWNDHFTISIFTEKTIYNVTFVFVISPLSKHLL